MGLRNTILMIKSLSFRQIRCELYESNIFKSGKLSADHQNLLFDNSRARLAAESAFRPNSNSIYFRLKEKLSHEINRNGSEVAEMRCKR